MLAPLAKHAKTQGRLPSKLEQYTRTRLGSDSLSLLVATLVQVSCSLTLVSLPSESWQQGRRHQLFGCHGMAALNLSMLFVTWPSARPHNLIH